MGAGVRCVVRMLACTIRLMTNMRSHGVAHSRDRYSNSHVQGWYASRAVQFHPHGDHFDVVWLSARTPHAAYVRRARRNQERHPPEIYYRSFFATFVTRHGEDRRLGAWEIDDPKLLTLTTRIGGGAFGDV